MARGWLTIFLLWAIFFAILMAHPLWTTSVWKTVGFSLFLAAIAGLLAAAVIFVLVTFF